MWPNRKKWIYPFKWKNISRSWLYLCSLIVPALAMLCACSVLNTEMRLIAETFENDLNQIFWACMNEHPQQTIILTKTACQQASSGHCYSYSYQLHSFQLNYVRIDESEVSMQVSDIDIDLVALNNGKFRSLMILQNHMTSQSFIRHYDVFIRL